MDDQKPLGTRAGHPYIDAVHLLERERELEVLRSAVREVAAGGQGAGFALTGDSGAGKSALVDAACADASGLRVLRTHCDPLFTPRPLGPFRDLAQVRGLEDVGRRDDVLLPEVCEQVFEVLREQPTLLVVEDVHWVDAASVDVLRFLARRIETMPMLLLVTYRDNEIGPHHAARPLLGDLATSDGLSTLALAPLSVDAVKRLAHDTALDPARVHAVTGGNPFFVTQVVKEPDLPMPTSVRDAVLARVADVSPEDFEVLQLVATAPDRLDDRVLPRLGVDLPTLRRLDATGLLTRTENGIVFRHELVRQAVESTIPPGGSSRLHAHLLDALERVEPREPAVLTHHAVLARDSARAATYARAAAADAIRAGAHTEAGAFFEVALENLDHATPGERAELLLALSFQQYMTSRLAVAIENARATFPLWQEAGNDAGLADAHAAVAIYEYYNARRRQAEDHLDRAAAIATEAGSRLAFGHARTSRAYLAYMRSDVGLTLDCLRQVDDVIDEQPEDFLELRRRVIDDANALVGGDDAARSRLFDHMEAARAHGFDELASTVYSNLANLDVEHGRYRAAERVLEESLPFTFERDIPICRHWQTGVRTRLQFVRGHWNAALEDAASVLDARGMPFATLWPHLVTALVPLRRGDEAPLSEVDDAWALAERLDEPLRRLAVLAALAEVVWMTDRPDPRVTDYAVSQLPALGAAPGAGWAAGNVAVWLRRLGLPTDLPVEVAEPFRLSLEGHHAEAASWWHLTGDPFAEAMAWADSPDPEERVRAVTQLDKLGAIGTADRLRVALRQEGLATVPQRPRESTRANPGGLTNRQLDVARLVARGLSNNEIAARLYISPKTADHHVSAILAKLDLPNRRAVVVQADELGLA
jgi:DNA-binding CsgD family transcriptional regulator